MKGTVVPRLSVASKVALITVLAIETTASTARTDPSDPRAADALFREARDLIKAGDCENAIPKLRASQRLDPAAGTLLSLAQCEEKMDKPGSAWLHYRQAVDMLPADDTRRTYAVARRDANEAASPKLSVKPSADVPDDATIMRDGNELQPDELNVFLPVDAGDHVVIVSCPNHSEARFAMLVGHASSKTIRVACGEPSNEAAATTVHGDEETDPDAAKRTLPSVGDSGDSTGTWGLVLGGAGIVAVGAGAYFAVHAAQLDQEATNSTDNYNDLGYCNTYCSERNALSRKNSIYSYVSFGTGGALLLGGIGLLLLAPSQPDATESSKLSVGVVANSTATTLRVGGAW